MSDEPATTPAAETLIGRLNAIQPEWEAGAAADHPPLTPAADRHKPLFEVASLIEQRDEARRDLFKAEGIAIRVADERDEARNLAAAWEAGAHAWERRTDEARREVERYSETIRAIGLRNMRLQREAREARAQAVQATTDADDLRARVAEAADWCADRSAYYGPYDPGARDAYDAAGDYVRWALGTPTRAETGSTAAGSPQAADDTSPDLLGPQIGAEQ